MREVGVAFLIDETTAELIASRLRTAGIPARVDRGLWGSYQVPFARGHVTVVVADRDAAGAHRVLGTSAIEERGPGVLSWFAIGFLVVALLFSIVAVVSVAAR